MLSLLFSLLLVTPAEAANPIDQNTTVIEFGYNYPPDFGYPCPGCFGGASGSAEITLVGKEDTTVNPDCTETWADDLCRSGTFETDDGGEGIFKTWAASPPASDIIQRVEWTYDSTGVTYHGFLNTGNPSGLWMGWMTGPEWGVFSEL